MKKISYRIKEVGTKRYYVYIDSSERHGPYVNKDKAKRAVERFREGENPLAILDKEEGREVPVDPEVQR